MKDHELLQTTDASVWAREFVKKFSIADEGTMLAWFAGAIETGRDASRALAANASTPTVCPAGPVVEGELRAAMKAHLPRGTDLVGWFGTCSCGAGGECVDFETVDEWIDHVFARARAALTNDPAREGSTDAVSK
jgi:hypothetical protein